MEQKQPAERWFLHSQGNTLGPLAAEQVIYGLENGEFQPTDNIYTVHANSWGPLAEHPFFSPQISALKSPSAKHLVPPPPPRFLRKRLPALPPPALLVVAPALPKPVLVPQPLADLPIPAPMPMPAAAPEVKQEGEKKAPALPLERPKIPPKQAKQNVAAPVQILPSAALPSTPPVQIPASIAEVQIALVKNPPAKAPKAKKNAASAKKADAAAKPKAKAEETPAPTVQANPPEPVLEIEPFEPEPEGIPLPALVPELEFVPMLETAAAARKQKQKIVPEFEPATPTLEVEAEAPLKALPAEAPLAAVVETAIPPRPEYKPLLLGNAKEWTEARARRAFREPAKALANVIRFEVKLPVLPYRGLMAVGLAVLITITTGLLMSGNKTRDLKDFRLPDPSSPTTAPLEAGDPIPPLKAPTRPQRE